jgi:hypothetical protein
MSKFKVQIKFKREMTKSWMFRVWTFDIPLTFACLREAASAKAGILSFEIRTA